MPVGTLPSTDKWIFGTVIMNYMSKCAAVLLPDWHTVCVKPHPTNQIINSGGEKVNKNK